MDENSLISIIIPVYNVRPYLTEALDSVLCQTYEKLEIIIVNDGSTDGSGEVCDTCAERDARVIVIHQENKGLSAARNVGLDRMTGEVVAFLDSDDAYDPRYIENMWRAMFEEKADMAVCKYTVHHTVGKLFSKGDEKASPSIGQGLYDGLDVQRALADRQINVSVWNKLYRRKLWKNLRFPEGHIYEDMAVTFRIIERCEMVYVLDQPLYLHRNRPGSITNTVSSDNIRDWELAYAHYARFIEENTPDIFTPEQRMRVQSGMLGSMIGKYVRCFGYKCIDSKALRAHTLALGRRVGIGSVNWRTKIAYVMLRTSPWLLRVAFPVYNSIRRLMYRIFGQ